MGYVKTNWVNDTTDVDATNMNHIEQGIENAYIPVGGIAITSTNTNPSATYGGTWSLIDKEFISNYGSNISTYWTDSANATCTSFYMVRGGHTIHLAITLTTNTAIADSNVTLGTVNYEALGITGSIYARRITGFSDTGDALVGANLAYNTGVLSTFDVFPHGTLASGNSVVFNVDIITYRTNMLDAKCDKFFWKRTA